MTSTLRDGLCRPCITVRPHHLLCTVCIRGGNNCPLLDQQTARSILERVKQDPTVTIRLESDADEIPHYKTLTDDACANLDREAFFNRKRDLDVLQRLGLLPGGTLRARYLYTLLFERIETPNGICRYETTGWEGCRLATSGAYESIRKRGWQEIVYVRTPEEKASWRRRNVKDIQCGPRLYVRPHHLMCLCCSYDGGRGMKPRPEDTLYEMTLRIRSQPDVPITLVDGTCQACECCDGFHPATGRCVHSGGLIRDYKKDLDCFQKLGLWPGATLPARELFSLLFERIPSTRDVCAYGDGIARSHGWSICGDPEGNPSYERTRKSGLFG